MVRQEKPSFMLHTYCSFAVEVLLASASVQYSTIHRLSMVPVASAEQYNTYTKLVPACTGQSHSCCSSGRGCRCGSDRIGERRKWLSILALTSK